MEALAKKEAGMGDSRAREAEAREAEAREAAPEAVAATAATAAAEVLEEWPEARAEGA